MFVYNEAFNKLKLEWCSGKEQTGIKARFIQIVSILKDTQSQLLITYTAEPKSDPTVAPSPKRVGCLVLCPVPQPQSQKGLSTQNQKLHHTFQSLYFLRILTLLAFESYINPTFPFFQS